MNVPKELEKRQVFFRRKSDRQMFMVAIIVAFLLGGIVL